MTKREPWQDPPVHPAADMLPMVSEAELEALAADIKANGLQQPIVVWEDNTAAAKGSAGPFPTYLLDGRNRLAALKRLGIKDPRDAPRAKAAQYTPGWGVRYLSALVKTSDLTSRGMSKPKWLPDVNPITFVLSMNVHRRHLNSEQKRHAIAAYLKADPTTSDRTVAKELGVSDKTAGKVRADLQARAEIPHVSTRTDSAGRKQPATKRRPTPKPKATPKPEPINEPKRAPAPEPVEVPKPEPPGGLTKESPGYTERVRQALESAKTATEPEPEDSDSGPKPTLLPPAMVEDYELVIKSDGTAYMRVMFCGDATLCEIPLNQGRLDARITQEMAEHLALRVGRLCAPIRELEKRLRHRAKPLPAGVSIKV